MGHILGPAVPHLLRCWCWWAARRQCLQTLRSLHQSRQPACQGAGFKEPAAPTANRAAALRPARWRPRGQDCNGHCTGVPFTPYRAPGLQRHATASHCSELSRAWGWQVRAAVKDSTDLGDVPFYLDSDGRVNDSTHRPMASFQSVVDGKWHMVTLTTRPDLQRGCASCAVLPLCSCAACLQAWARRRTVLSVSQCARRHSALVGAGSQSHQAQPPPCSGHATQRGHLCALQARAA